MLSKEFDDEENFDEEMIVVREIEEVRGYLDSRPSSVVTVPDNDTAKKDDFSGFKQSLDIDWNTPHVHEVQQFFTLLGGYTENKEMASIVCKNLWVLLCCLARDVMGLVCQRILHPNPFLSLLSHYWQSQI